MFFVVPLGFLAYQSLESGNIDFGYAFTWAWSNYRDALSNYRAQFIRSLEYAGIATALALVLSYPVAYWIAFRGGRWKNLLLLFIVAPFFVTYLIRTLAWETILSDNGFVVNTLQSLHVLGPERAAARDLDRRGGGHHLQLPALHGAAAVRVARADRRAADRGCARTSTRASCTRSCA